MKSRILPIILWALAFGCLLITLREVGNNNRAALAAIGTYLASILYGACVGMARDTR